MWIQRNITQATTELELSCDKNKQGIKCNNPKTLNTLLDNIVQSIDEQSGLKKLIIDGFEDKNSLNEQIL